MDSVQLERALVTLRKHARKTFELLFGADSLCREGRPN